MKVGFKTCSISGTKASKLEMSRVPSCIDEIFVKCLVRKCNLLLSSAFNSQLVGMLLLVDQLCNYLVTLHLPFPPFPDNKSDECHERERIYWLFLKYWSGAVMEVDAPPFWKGALISSWLFETVGWSIYVRPHRGCYDGLDSYHIPHQLHSPSIYVHSPSLFLYFTHSFTHDNFSCSRPFDLR